MKIDAVKYAAFVELSILWVCQLISLENYLSGIGFMGGDRAIHQDSGGDIGEDNRH